MMSYNFAYSFGNDDFSIGMVVFWMVYLLAMLVLSVVLYVLRSLGLYSIAKNRGIRHPWLSWIPVADSYLLGCVSDQYQYVVKGRNKSKRKIMLVLSIVLCALYVVFFANFAGMFSKIISGVLHSHAMETILPSIFGTLMRILILMLPMLGVAIAQMVLHYMAMYDLYSSCSPQNNVLFLVLNILFRVTEPFFIFFNRNRENGMPPRRPDPQSIPSQQEPWDN